MNQLTGEKKAAEDYLNKRSSRSRDVKQLAMQFAINGDNALTARFKEALARFVTELPYELEEHRSNSAKTATLKTQAEEYAALAVVENYQRYRTPDKQVMITYQRRSRRRQSSAAKQR